MNKVVVKNYCLLLLISVIWGSQFALANIALKSIAPINIAVTRALIGCLTLGICSMFLPKNTSNSKGYATPWKLYILIAFFESVLPLFLLAWGLARVESGVGAILMGTVPIFTMLIATLVSRQERLRVQLVLSVILGFCGIVTLSFPNLHGANSSIWGELAILLSSLSFGVSLILMSYLPAGSSIRQMRNILGIAVIPLLIASLGLNLWSVPSISGVIAVLILGIFCTGIVYLMFMILIRNTTPTFASLTNYLIPLIGVIIGCVFMQEKLFISELVALVLILAALVINQIKIRGL